MISEVSGPLGCNIYGLTPVLKLEDALNILRLVGDVESVSRPDDDPYLEFAVFSKGVDQFGLRDEVCSILALRDSDEVRQVAGDALSVEGVKVLKVGDPAEKAASLLGHSEELQPKGRNFIGKNLVWVSGHPTDLVITADFGQVSSIVLGLDLYRRNPKPSDFFGPGR